MPLSDDERKRLRELEEELAAQDPHLARKLGARGLSNKPDARKVYGLLVTIAGLALVILGISLQLTIVGVMGFLTSGAGSYVFLDSFSPHWPSPGRKTPVYEKNRRSKTVGALLICAAIKGLSQAQASRTC